jgi:hypothetical protein
MTDPIASTANPLLNTTGTGSAVMPRICVAEMNVTSANNIASGDTTEAISSADVQSTPNVTLSADRVIIGRDYYDGHVDRWRAGVIVPESLDTSRGFGGGIFINVRCAPRGRERKERVIQCVATALLRDTPNVRAKLLAAGFDPDRRNGLAEERS